MGTSVGPNESTHAKADKAVPGIPRPSEGREPTMSWTQEASIAHPRWFLAAATCTTKIYAVGGILTSSSTGNEPVSTVEAYDPSKKTWSTTASIPAPLRQGFDAASAAGQLHIVGGADSNFTPLATHNAYNPATNQWSTLAPLTTARGNPAAVTGSDGKIYVIGGTGTGSNSLTTVEAYDPAHDTWTTMQPMPTPRNGLAAAATSNGFVYAIGGISTTAVNTVEIFDIAANSWTTCPHQLPEPTAFLGAAAGPNDVIFAIGGQQQLPNSSTPFVTNVYSYNPAASAAGWLQQAPMPDCRAGCGIATGPDGLVYAIGGMTCPQQVIVGEVDAYTYDKCDYIEYEISGLGQEIAAEEANLDGGDLTPQQREAGEKALAPLRARMVVLEKALQTCRG